MTNHGKFVISLDFELMWGMLDKRTIDSCGDRVLGVHRVIPRLLELFREFGVRCTFAAVGFVFFANKEELTNHLPKLQPGYADARLSPYPRIAGIGCEKHHEPYYFGSELIKCIQRFPGHEIASHTFSHYYCLEGGQTVQEFREDLRCAIEIAKSRGIEISALVFPRNQTNEKYLQVCRELNILCYR